MHHAVAIYVMDAGRSAIPRKQSTRIIRALHKVPQLRAIARNTGVWLCANPGCCAPTRLSRSQERIDLHVIDTFGPGGCRCAPVRCFVAEGTLSPVDLQTAPYSLMLGDSKL